jgi:hypothetical protein
MAGIELRSPSLDDHQPIPARHAKDHENLSPALEWSGVPEEAAELAVLCEDPDAPRGTFIHWVLAGLQPTASGLAEGEHPAAAVEGRNDFGEEGYSVPAVPGLSSCPRRPPGRPMWMRRTVSFNHEPDHACRRFRSSIALPSPLFQGQVANPVVWNVVAGVG